MLSWVDIDTSDNVYKCCTVWIALGLVVVRV